MAKIYQHWEGHLTVETGHFSALTIKVDQWFPDSKPNDAHLRATDTFPTPVDVFEHLIIVRGKIGPFKITLPVDLAFEGMIEYWEAE